MIRETKYWIVVASKDHVQKGIHEEIMQTCHGKATPLNRMQKNDYIIYYSGKSSLTESIKCQEFTAIGKIKSENIYPYQISEDFCPFRREVSYYNHKDTSILPLINDLEFIKNKKSWGYPFRFGFIEINKHDFDLISTQMLQ